MEESALDLDDVADLLINEVADHMSIMLCFEMHRAWHTGQLTAHELWHAQNAVVAEPKPERELASKAPVTKSMQVVDCPNCHTTVSANRFAPHLEKCMSTSGRQAAARSRAARPTSLSQNKPLIVRIKLRNGVPIQTGHRRLADS